MRPHGGAILGADEERVTESSACPEHELGSGKLSKSRQPILGAKSATSSFYPRVGT